MDKKSSRLRRSRKARAKIRELGVPRLTVHRTPRHIYAQLINPDSSVIASAGTVDKAVSDGLTYTGNVDGARAVGKAIAERAAAAGVTKAAFDRSGFRYHGRIKALADAARENGLEI
ncbi:MAG TPA: 50S ribosomal protein L18 [Porticoccaceae bacterium]|nr:50S ribosomal protein L18 [Porticoccaceae bacterium]